jgi:hypothetical protein
MKHTASAKKSSSARSTSTRSRRATATDRQFAVCVDNNGYEASLERNKISVVLSDKNAESDTDIRMVDESGEDYLFSAARFVPPRGSGSRQGVASESVIPIDATPSAMTLSIHDYRSSALGVMYL